MNREVTVVIPTLPQRHKLLGEAIESVQKQTHPVEIITEMDTGLIGAAPTRNAGMMRVTTEWTGFLDDDDLLLPNHYELLLNAAEEHNADMVWGWFEVINGTDPFPDHFRGLQWNLEKPHVIPITVLCRTSMLHAAYEHMGGFQFEPEAVGAWAFQDKPVWWDIATRQKGVLHAIPDTTWSWRHHSKNTSGLGTAEIALRAGRTPEERREAARIGVNKRTDGVRPNMYEQATAFYPNVGFTMDPLEGKDVMPVLLEGLSYLDDYWLSAGTLLGLERDNGFIPADTDLDIAVMGHWDRARLPEADWWPVRLCEYDGKHMQSAYMHRETNIIFDVFHYWPHLDDPTKIINIQSHGHIAHIDANIRPSGTKTYLGHEFTVPRDIDLHLTEWYGDWRTPMPGGKTEWVK